MENRRGFIRTLSLAAGALTLPNLATRLLPHTASAATGEAVPVVDRTLERLLANERGAFLIQGVQAIQWLNATASLLTILNLLGLNTEFFNRVDYREASQCKGNFQSLENAWRPYFDSFTNVQRARPDRDVAYLVGARSTDSSSNAVGGTQYRNLPVVSLRDDEPGVALAATMLLGQNYNLSQRELAHSVALTKKEHHQVDLNGERVPLTRYETPTVSYVHYSRHRRYPKGLLVVHNKMDRNNPNNLHPAGLYV